MIIATIDDESYYVDKIAQILEEHFPIHIIRRFYTMHDLLSCKDDIDVLFLDIEMPEANGLDFAKDNVFRYPNIVFVSTHKECVWDAFGTNVAGFIVKQDDLEGSIIMKLESIEKRLMGQAKIKLNTVDGMKYMSSYDILYFHIEDECIYLNTSKKSVRLTTTSLSRLAEGLDKKFVFVSRDYIVNISHITNFIKKDKKIELSNMMEIKVSERRWKNLIYMTNELVNIR